MICGKNRVFSPQKQIFNLKTVKSSTLHFFSLAYNEKQLPLCWLSVCLKVIPSGNRQKPV
jgi:hypothetical protein